MTVVVIENMEFDLEQFSTQLLVFERHMRGNSLMIPTPGSMVEFINMMIEERNYANRADNRSSR